MKLTFFIAFTFLFSSAFSQKYFLIHKGMTSKPMLTDSVSKDQLSKGYFPVLTSDIDSIVPFLKQLKKLNKMGLNRETIDNSKYNSKTIQFEVANVSHPYGDRYEIDLISNTDAGKFTYKLCSAASSNLDNQDKAKNLYSYIVKSKLVKIN